VHATLSHARDARTHNSTHHTRQNYEERDVMSATMATCAPSGLSASRSRYSCGASDVAALVPNQRPTAAAKSRQTAAPLTEARLRPGRTGVQRIYRMTTEKSQISVVELYELHPVQLTHSSKAPGFNP
jgi:hypothetical protein